jgi:hypothetical protein
MGRDTKIGTGNATDAPTQQTGQNPVRFAVDALPGNRAVARLAIADGDTARDEK